MEKKNFVLDHVLHQSLFIWKYLYEKLLFFETQKKINYKRIQHGEINKKECLTDLYFPYIYYIKNGGYEEYYEYLYGYKEVWYNFYPQN